MAVTIAQKPLYNILPIGQQVVFSVSENTIVATMFKVKFVAEVRISTSSGINPNTSDDLIGTFKTTPNNAGVGIFDLRSILETFVSPDYEASLVGNATYKGISSSIVPFPLHLVDKYSLNNNSVRFFAVRFLVEYATTAGGSVVTPTATKTDSTEYIMFNGVLQYDNYLTKSLYGNNYGYNIEEFELTDSSSKFLSNAPTTQYARLTDYGTFPFLNFTPTSSDTVSSLTLKYYNSSDVQLGADYVLNTTTNGVRQ